MGRPLGKMSRRLLGVLGESPLSVPTPDLVALVATGKSFPRSRVWNYLRTLERGGLVCRVGKVGGVTRWGLAEGKPS